MPATASRPAPRYRTRSASTRTASSCITVQFYRPVYISAMGLRERKKEQTRAALIDAATRSFARNGYDATTVADITAAAGVSTRTFFSYFRAKQDVLFAGT